MIAWEHLKASPVFEKIQNDWAALLDDESKKEQHYQTFLCEHAGFFFDRVSDASGNQLVLEKIKFGADYISDFVNSNGNRSLGFEYTLIEIESPHDRLYTVSGNQSSHLHHALEQIRSWKAWVAKYPDSARQIFPSKQFNSHGVPSLKYMVIIGRRKNINPDEIEKRNQIKRDENIEVRSFDYLTDVFRERYFNSYTWLSHDFRKYSDSENNEFSNPFYSAISDASWRAMLKNFHPNYSHMVDHNVATILEHRQYNDLRLNEYLDWVNLNGKNDISEWQQNFLRST